MKWAPIRYSQLFNNITGNASSHMPFIYKEAFHVFCDNQTENVFPFLQISCNNELLISHTLTFDPVTASLPHIVYAIFPLDRQISTRIA